MHYILKIKASTFQLCLGNKVIYCNAKETNIEMSFSTAFSL